MTPAASPIGVDPGTSVPVSATDRAYARIRDAIGEGVYAAGEPLREEDVAEFVGVSRTPVREAFRRLGAEGLVDLLPNRGARVVAWDEHDVEEIFGLRVLLEGYGARLAAGRRTEAELSAMIGICEAMEAEVARGPGVRFERLTELNNQLHQTILRAGGNRRLVAAASSVVVPALVTRTFHLYRPEELARSCAHHRELIDAITEGDGDWAESVMRAHLYAGQRAARRDP